MSKTQPMARFVDALIVEGVTWEKLATVAKREAEKRGLKVYTKPGDLRSHITYQAKRGWKFEETETGIRGWPPAVTQPDKAKPAKAKPAKPKREAAPKNGKPTGRKVAKKTENGRQVVEPVTVAEPVEVA